MQVKAYIFKKEGHFKMARKKIIAGNWKMNKTPSEAVAMQQPPTDKGKRLK